MDEQTIRRIQQEVEDDLADARWDGAGKKLASLAAQADGNADQALAAWVDDARADLAEMSTAEDQDESAAVSKSQHSSWAWLPFLAIFLILWSGGGWATFLLVFGLLIGAGILLWIHRASLPLDFRTQMVRRVGVVRRAGVVRGVGVVRRVADVPSVSELPPVHVAGGAVEPLVQGDDPRWTYSVVTTLETVGFRPRGVAVSPDGRRVYVIDSPSPDPYGPSTVSVVDVLSNRHMARVEVEEELVGVAVSPEGDRLYVVNSTGGSVSVIDTSSFMVLASVEVGAEPRAVAVSPDGARIYVANAGSNTISVIERATSSDTVVDGDVLHSARLDAGNYALLRQYLAQREELSADARAARARELSRAVAAQLEVTPPQNSGAVDAFLEWVAAAYQARQRTAAGGPAAPEPQQGATATPPPDDATARADDSTTQSEQPPAAPTDSAAPPPAPDSSAMPPTLTQPTYALDVQPPTTSAEGASLASAPDSSPVPSSPEPTDAPGEVAVEQSADQPPALAPSDQPALPTVGQTASNADWEVTLTTYGPYERLAEQPASGRPEGRPVLVEFAARNRQDRTATFTLSDFALDTAGGRKLSPAAQTSYIEKGVALIQTVPPAGTTEHRIVFDLDRGATDLTLQILGLRFSLPQ